jgi:hypothetical protein
MTTDLLEDRLQKLSVETPDAGRVAARVLSRASRRRARRLPRALAAGVATIALLVLVAYFVPAAGTAIASVPLAGDLLRDAGLVGAAGRITSVGSESTSSGYTLKLVGAYADTTRMVLLVHADPPIGIGGPLATQLTDQFGRSYSLQGGTGNLKTGDSVLQFDALAWPDGIAGARITLRVSSVNTADETGPGQPVAGSWTLPATLGVDEGTTLALPSPATLGSAHYRFTSVSYTPATVSIGIEVTGVSFDYLSLGIPDGRGKPTAALNIDLIDPNGQVINGNSSMSDDFLGRVQIHLNGFRLGAHGRYVLRVSYAGVGQFESVLTIP